MNVPFRVPNRIAAAVLTVLALVVTSLPSSPSTRVTKAATKKFFDQTNLVSDQPGVALITDPNLVNPWGISMTATSPF
jgi:hypothetical protein